MSKNVEIEVAKYNGPEFAPLGKYYESFPIRVVVYDKDDIIIRECKMDYGNPKDRGWLGRISFWAWIEGHSVETYKDE